MAELAAQPEQSGPARPRIGTFEIGARDTTVAEHGNAIAVHAVGAAESVHAGQSAICYCRQNASGAVPSPEWFERAKIVRHEQLIPVLDAGISGQTAFIIESSAPGERVSQRLMRGGETTPARVAMVLEDTLCALDAAWQSGFDLVIAPDTVRLLDNGRAQVSLAFSMCLNPRPGAGSESSAQFQMAFLTALLLSGQPDPARLCIEKLRGADKYLGISLFRERMNNLSEFVALVLVKALDEDSAQRYPSVAAYLAEYKESLKATADSLAFGALEAKSREGEAMALAFGEMIKRYDEQHQEIAGLGGRLVPKGSPLAVGVLAPAQAVIPPSVLPQGDAKPEVQLPPEVTLTPEIAALLAGPTYEPSKPRGNPWLGFAVGMLLIMVAFLAIVFVVMTES
jgi:hypothetical protein